MARLVQTLAAKVEAGAENDYYRVLLKRLEEDLKEEIRGINEGTAGGMEMKPVRWVRAKAVHSYLPFQAENDYGFKGGDLSIRGEFSTSGTWGLLGYDIRPEFNLYRDGVDNSEAFGLHSGYIVAWLKNVEIEAGKDALWWGPGRQGNWVLTNNAPAFDLLKVSNAVTTVPPGFLSYLGDTRFTVFLGKISEQKVSYLHDGAQVSEMKRPLFMGGRLDISPFRLVELGVSQAIEFVDRGGNGYPLDYLRQTIIPSYQSNEEEESTGPVANRVQAFDITLNIGREYGFMKNLGLQGMKFYWTWGGETMVIDPHTKLPRTCFTGNLFGLYLDTGKTAFRTEYASNLDAGTAWYSHYQFTGGYMNEGFVLGHYKMGGNRRDLFMSLSHPVTDAVVAMVHFNGNENGDGGGNIIYREDIFGLSIDAFGGKGEKIGISYEYRKGDTPGDANQIWALEGVWRF